MDINLNKICRICLKEGDNYKSIFCKDEFSSQNVSLSTKIMACSSIEVISGDGLPELICLECLIQVDIAYDFKEKCQNADATLRKYVSLYSYAEPNEYSVKLEVSQDVKDESSGNKLGTIKLMDRSEGMSSDKVDKVVTETSVVSDGVAPLSNQKKRKQDKVEGPKVRKQKGRKKCTDEEGVSESDKKKRMKEVKDVKCPICKKTFAYLCILKDHMVQHTGAKPYLCSACGKSFGHTATLNNHMKTHYSDKPHKCDRCELSFHRRAHLVLHLRTHTGEKPYICDVCGRDFAQRGYLKEHKRVHSGEKPFVCDICGHSFARKSCLVMHRRIHTGELPYACPECGRGFSQRSQRKRHVKKNHKGSACLRATGELILKDLDLKNKNSKPGETLSEPVPSDNSLTENLLVLPGEGNLMQRDVTVPLQQYHTTDTSIHNTMSDYQQDNLSALYTTTMMQSPLIQIQTSLLQ